MTDFELYFPEINYRFPMIHVAGTEGAPYLFGEKNDNLPINIRRFFISKFPVTQTLWTYVMGNNPSFFKEENRPVECVSYHDVTGNSGFLQKLQKQHGIGSQLSTSHAFRLPSETEWEYSARGGVHWKDDFLYAGSNILNDVGWYDQNSGDNNDPSISLLKNQKKGTRTHNVGQKAPNQLGIFDMSGNVWEWCEDYYQSDLNLIPKDGTPCSIDSAGRILRGGCHHNWAIHCTVSKRYQIVPEAKDECIGFRIAVSA